MRVCSIGILYEVRDVDIFCFQDVLFGSKPEFTPIQQGRINLFAEMEKVLSDFNSVVYRDPEESYFHGELLSLKLSDSVSLC